MTRTRSITTPEERRPFTELFGPCARWLLGLAWIVMLGTTAVLAQSAGVAAPPVRFTVFAAEPVAGLGYIAAPSGGPVPLRFYPTARSPIYEHRGRQPLRLVEIGTERPVAEVSLPEGMRDVLLLVSSPPDTTGRRQYRVTVLDDGPRQRRAGQIQILNMSGLELAGELNGRRLALAPGLNAPLAAGPSARVVLRTTFRGRSYVSWHDTISLGPTGRALLILFPPFLPGSIEVQTRVLRDELSGNTPADRSPDR